MSKLDSQMFNNPAKEQQAVEEHALAIASMMEALALPLVTFSKEGFPESCRGAFEKNLKRCIDAVVSTVPNQYRHKVLSLIEETNKAMEAEDAAKTAEEKPAVHAEPDNPPAA